MGYIRQDMFYFILLYVNIVNWAFFLYTLIFTESNLIFVHLHTQVWKRTCSQDSMQSCEKLSAPHASVAYGKTFSSSNMTHKSSLFISLSHHCGGYWPTFLYSVALVRWHLQGLLCAAQLKSYHSILIRWDLDFDWDIATPSFFVSNSVLDLLLCLGSLSCYMT